MNRDFFTKFKNTVSGRLLLLRKKIKGSQNRFGTVFHANIVRLQQNRESSPKKPRVNWQVVKINTIPLCLVAIMLVLLSGTMQSLAWYTDTAMERNSFVIGDMELKVYYDNDVTDAYVEMTSTSNVFNDQARYEPGYTQVVYFKIENAGNVDFDYKISVTEVEEAAVDSRSITGKEIHLADYLRFGLVTADTEPQLTRALAREEDDGTVKYWLHEIGEYSEYGDNVLKAGEEDYGALIVYMPEDVGNEANYDQHIAGPPNTVLGITVYAQQADTMEKT